MDWTSFLDYLAKDSDSGIILPLMRNCRLVSYDEQNCTIECENLGAKFFLDSKRAIVEEFVWKFTSRHVSIAFTVGVKKTRKSQKEKTQEDSSISLLQYQENQEDKVRLSGLQARFTFDNFAVSNSNHMAHAAAQAVSTSPGTMYNPLFIYGDVGVGKTHLSHAVANAMLEKDIRKRVLYCTSEQFTNDLVDAIKIKRTQAIRDKYRKLDILIVDDVQFIAGKTYVQEEFYHTFNAIVQQGGQIIMTSDRPPREIKSLEDRLRSRFSGGLIIDMQKPDFELRTAIVLIKAQERNIDIDMGAAQNIAEKIDDSRELEGALLKLLSLSLSQSDSNKITSETALTELNRQDDRKKAKITPQDIIKAVATYYDLKPSHIRGTSRKQNIAFARQVTMFLLRTKLKLNLDEVAFIVKKKDHTTVIHAVEKLQSITMKDASIAMEIQKIYNSISLS